MKDSITKQVFDKLTSTGAFTTTTLVVTGAILLLWLAACFIAMKWLWTGTALRFALAGGLISGLMAHFTVETNGRNQR